MKTLNYISEITSIDTKYLILVFKTIVFFLILSFIKKIGIKILKHIKDNKKEYIYTQRYKLLVNITKFIVFLLLWGEYLGAFLTLISVISAAFTIAVYMMGSYLL